MEHATPRPRTAAVRLTLPVPLSLGILLVAAVFLIQANRACGSEQMLESAMAVAEGPSVVDFVQDESGDWQYLVNGQSTYLVGMGYNAIYRHLSDQERGDRYERDFAILRAAGVNTILGWDFDKGVDQDKFDFVTLNKAYQAGLGVVMPLYLPYEGDYTDPAFRESLKREYLAKVERYRAHPALRMWGLGNEVLNDMGPERRAVQARAFGEFYLELADAIHLADPNHPVIYRESGETYWRGIARTLNRQLDRPWLLIGLNLYTLEPDPILDSWPEQGLNKPLILTEFGPPEYFDYENRAEYYLNIWRAARDRPSYIVGAAPYVWTVEGPEPVDRYYGLTNGAGVPVDGTFEALRDEFLRVPNR